MRYGQLTKTAAATCAFATLFAVQAHAVITETYETHPGFFRNDSFGEWHKENPKARAISHSKARLSIRNNSRDYDPDLLVTSELVEQELPFDSTIWQQQGDKRAYMVKALLLKHSLIGMRRLEVHKLLGFPDDLKRFVPPKDSSTKDAEWYRLAEPFTSCVISGPHFSTILALELSYADDKVDRFRLTASKSGHSQVSGANPFAESAVEKN